MSNFDPNAVLRGAQLTLVGANRALQNKDLFRHEHFRQALIAVAVGIIIQAIISLPTNAVRVFIWLVGLSTDLDKQTWDDSLSDFLHVLQHSVLQLPFFLMNLLKFVSPALDDMFMESLDFVDKTYLAKHRSDSPASLRALYYPTLRQYHSDLPPKSKSNKKGPLDGIAVFLKRYARKAVLSLAIYLLSYLPYIGRFVLPAASFYTFRKAVGNQPAVAIFACGLVLPRRHFIKFLQTFFSSRSMMRELLEPYFSRIYFTPNQKKRWFRDREGVLFGFGVGFFLLVKIPLVGVLVYGIAEASTAYLITKITDPPPEPTDQASRMEFIENQTTWHNKSNFLSMPLSGLDALNIKTNKASADPAATEFKSRQFA